VSLADGRTREDFAALGSFRGDAEGLYAATRGRDWDIQLWDWIAAASPRPELPPIDQIERWVWAWLYCSRWAGTVGRRPAYIYHAKRAGIGPLIDAARNRIVEVADSWTWPAIEELGVLDDERLETTYALFEAADHVSSAVMREVGAEAEDLEYEQAWKLALRLELGERGQLPKVVTEVSEYVGAERILLSPTQLYTDEFGRTIPRSRLKKIVDEWCDFFEASTTSIRYLEITSRAPKRLVSALRGQTQLRGLDIKWGDYDNVSPVAGMPDLWTLNLGGASGLTDITALRSASSLRVLALEDCRRLTDFSPLGDLDTLEELSLTSGFGSASLTVPTIGFVRGMTGLRRLLVGARVLDEDYSPLLARTDLEELWVRKQRSMRPSLDELQRDIPGLRSN
jgi:hypothetical protein